MEVRPHSWWQKARKPLVKDAEDTWPITRLAEINHTPLSCYSKEKTLNMYEYKTYFFGLEYESQQGSTKIERQGVMPDQQLTELGSQGWELVNVIKLTRFWSHGLGQGELPWGIQYVFKRPKQ